MMFEADDMHPIHISFDRSRPHRVTPHSPIPEQHDTQRDASSAYASLLLELVRWKARSLQKSDYKPPLASSFPLAALPKFHFLPRI